MKILFTMVLTCALFGSLKSQNKVPEESKLVDEITVSAKNGHYYRAERFVNQLRWTLKVKELSNQEDYKGAYKLSDSLRYYKNNQIPLDVSKAATVKTDEALENQIKSLKGLIEGGKLEIADAHLGELKIKLGIKEAQESMQDEKAILKKTVLDTYVKQNEEKYKSTVVSTCFNEFKIDSINKELEKPETAADDSVFSILQQELELRKKLKNYVDGTQFLSASMDYRRLKSFLKNPKPKSNKPPVKFVPTTENQKRMVWLQEQMMKDKQAGKYSQLWPMTQEYNFRAEIEKAIKKGDTKAVEALEKEIRGLK